MQQFKVAARIIMNIQQKLLFSRLVITVQKVSVIRKLNWTELIIISLICFCINDNMVHKLSIIIFKKFGFVGGNKKACSTIFRPSFHFNCVDD